MASANRNYGSQASFQIVTLSYITTFIYYELEMAGGESVTSSAFPLFARSVCQLHFYSLLFGPILRASLYIKRCWFAVPRFSTILEVRRHYRSFTFGSLLLSSLHAFIDLGVVAITYGAFSVEMLQMSLYDRLEAVIRWRQDSRSIFQQIMISVILAIIVKYQRAFAHHAQNNACASRIISPFLSWKEYRRFLSMLVSDVESISICIIYVVM